jgi:hypothetical protein
MVYKFAQRWRNQPAFAQPHVATDETNNDKALGNKQPQNGTGQIGN